MNPIQILLVIHARWKVALAVAIVTVGAGLVVNEMLPKKYTAETSVLVDVRTPDPVVAVLLQSTQMTPGSIATQVDVITSNRTSRKVVTMLKLDQSASVKESWLAATQGRGKLEDWLANALQRGVKVTPSRESNNLKISYSGTDPAFAAAIANAFAQAYIEASIELKVEPARQHARWFAEQAKVLRENVEKAQTRLSEYQKETGIVATEETYDTENTKLTDLAGRLNAVQAELRDAQTKQRSVGATADTLPEVLQNATISNLRADIVQREAKLKDSNLGSKHPQYLRMEAELAELRKSVEAETRRVTSGYSSSTAVNQVRQAELMAALEAQKKKVLQLKGGRDELAVLLRDVETAKRAYDAVSTRFNQTSLESQATQTNVSVLTPAVEPLEPSFPKPFVVTVSVLIVLGLIAGGASAFGFEMLDKRVRSTHDLAEMLQLPVIGVIARTKPQSRLAFWRRGAVPALR